jgi:hypothetical protein
MSISSEDTVIDNVWTDKAADVNYIRIFARLDPIESFAGKNLQRVEKFSMKLLTI